MTKINSTEKTNSVLSHINNGAIDFYFGLKFEANCSFEEIANTIAIKTEKVIDNYYISIKFALQNNIKDSFENAGFNDGFYIKDMVTPDKDIFTKESQFAGEIDNIELESTDKGFKIHATPKAKIHMDNLVCKTEASYEQNKIVYGDYYTNTHRRVILPPFKIILKNGEAVYTKGILYVFQNKSAILRLTLPLKNVDTQPLYTNDLDSYISSISDECGIDITSQYNTIDDLKKCYFRFFVKDNKRIKSVLSVCLIVSLLLSEQSIEIKDVKNIPQDLQEDIYKILIAPTPKRKNANYSEEAKDCFENSSFVLNGTRSIFSSTNKCVTLIDESIIEMGKEVYQEDDIDECLIDDMRNNIEFTINILMLKKINAQYAFHNKKNGIKKETQIQSEYDKDKIYISLLLGGTYGSVRAQVEAFENKMKYFIDSKNTLERMDAINNILEQKNSDKLQRLQNLLSIGGLMFTIFLGLPTITDTISLLRKLPFFTLKDLPYVSIDTVGFGIWLSSICTIIVLLIIAKIKKN